MEILPLKRYILSMFPAYFNTLFVIASVRTDGNKNERGRLWQPFLSIFLANQTPNLFSQLGEQPYIHRHRSPPPAQGVHAHEPQPIGLTLLLFTSHWSDSGNVCWRFWERLSSSIKNKNLLKEKASFSLSRTVLPGPLVVGESCVSSLWLMNCQWKWQTTALLLRPSRACFFPPLASVTSNIPAWPKNEDDAEQSPQSAVSGHAKVNVML